jgi:hypothetical protein
MVLTRFGSPTDVAAFGPEIAIRRLGPLTLSTDGGCEMLGFTCADMRIYVRRSAAS